jgi:hypothetical protein
MNKTDQLIEQHVREYESRLRRIDELMTKASENGITTATHPDLAEIFQHYEKFSTQLGSLKASQDQREMEDVLRYGPMAIWDVLAQKLEHVVEKIEKR